MSNQIVQEPNPNITLFFEEHCSKPGGVILVTVTDLEGETYDTGIFSDYAKANDWALSHYNNNDIAGSTFVPLFIDYPEYGGNRNTVH